MEQRPFVSICCLTYNHEPFIRQCLEGFLMQQTSFAFEVVIHDDASTDGTTAIIQEYETKYPNIIKPQYEKENQWRKGIRGSSVFNFPRAQGKYIALCEGDDYWVDPMKLQKQVYWLENNPHYSICYTSFKTVDFSGQHIVRDNYNAFINESVSGNILSKLFEHNFIITATICVRRQVIENYMETGFCIDYSLFFSAAFLGLAHYSPDQGVCYRQHSNSLTNSNLSEVNKMLEESYLYWATALLKKRPKYLTFKQLVKCWKNIFFHYYSQKKFHRLGKESMILCMIYYAIYYPQRKLKDYLKK